MSNDMPKPLAPIAFDKDMAARYDDVNSRLVSISENMHFLVRLVLQPLPHNARVLCVGAGTGAEILSLANSYPEWTFVGVDPSAEMLDVCRDKLKHAQVLDRCELIHGYVQDVPEGESFDAVVSILVAHFVEREDRVSFYQSVYNRLKQGGHFVSTEISFDLNSPEFPAMLENWGRIHSLMGAAPDSLDALANTLSNTLSVLSPPETKSLLKKTGFDLPMLFFQAFMIHGWSAVK